LAEKTGLIKEIIYEVMGEEPKISKSKNTFFFTRKNGVVCGLKIAQKEETQLIDTEASLYRFINRETSLPAPEVLGKGRWGTLSYLIYSTFSGPTLQDLLESGESWEDVLFSAGQLLGVLHSIELHQQGLLKPDLGIRKIRLFPQQEYQKTLGDLAETRIIPDRLLPDLLRVDLDFFFGDKSNVLCHGNYTPGNLFADKDRIRGIVGWEKARAAPPFLDLADFILELKIPNENISPTPFYEGYSRFKPLPSIYLEHEEFYKYYTLLFSLALGPEKEQTNLEERRKKLLLTYAEARDKWPKTSLEPTL